MIPVDEYTSQRFADSVMKRLKATGQVVKRNVLHTFAVLPKRWVVERSFGWLGKCRRLWKNCERKSECKPANDPLGLPQVPAQELVNGF